MKNLKTAAAIPITLFLVLLLITQIPNETQKELKLAVGLVFLVAFAVFMHALPFFVFGSQNEHEKPKNKKRDGGK